MNAHVSFNTYSLNVTTMMFQHRTRYTSRNASFRTTGGAAAGARGGASGGGGGAETDYKHISSMLEQQQQQHSSVYGRHGYEVRGDSAGSQPKRTYSASSSVKQQTCEYNRRLPLVNVMYA